MLGQVKFSAGTKIILGNVTLVLIVRTVYACRNLGGRIVCTGSKNPVAMLILSPHARSAVNMDGEEVSVEQYLAYPEIRDLVENL